MDEQSIIGIYGASGLGREVLPLVKNAVLESTVKTKIVFIDDNNNLNIINNHPVFTFEQFKNFPIPEKKAVVAIANCKIREKLFSKLDENSIEILSIKSTNSIIMDEVQIGKGSILSPFVTITSNINIGIGFQANIYSYVAHDCQIGNFVTFAPGVKCNGNVIVEDYAYLGTGAIIKQGRPGKPIIIGRGATVGMGSVVTKNVKAGETVIGNPARPLSKENLRA